MRRLRILPLVTHSHAAALAELDDMTLDVDSPVEDRVRRAKGPFQANDVVRTPMLSRGFDWGFRTIFKF